MDRYEGSMNFLISTVMMVGVLLVDARNVFISVNHMTALWNARVVWPQCSRFLLRYVRLFVHDLVQFLLNREGVMQDLFSMMLHVVSVLPLIWFLENSSQ